MSTVLKRAAKAAAKDGKRKPETESESDDSDTLAAKLEERARKKKAKLELKEKRDEEAAILKQLNDQTAKNARRLKELADARNAYPVILYMILDLSVTNQILVQTAADAAPQAERSPKGVPSPIPSSSDPFDVIRGHVPMQTLNNILLPWLIAEYGIDFASLDNTDVASEMISHIIMKHELGGYTKTTFPAIIDGHAMQRTAFSKFVLRQLGISFHFMY